MTMTFPKGIVYIFTIYMYDNIYIIFYHKTYREHMIQIINNCPEYEFKKYFRCTRIIFRKLLTIVETYLAPPHYTKARRNPITLLHRLAVYLR